MVNNSSAERPVFYAFYNRAGRLLRALSRDLIVNNPELAQNILPPDFSIRLLPTCCVHENSCLYETLLKRARDGEIAWIFYPSKRDLIETVFSFHDGVYYVEKKILKRSWRFLPGKFRQRALPREPLHQGRLLGERFRLLVQSGDWVAVRKELISFLRALITTFPEIKHGILPAHTVDAIPRNCIVDREGSYCFFDLEYEMIGGCRLSYIIYSAVKADIVSHLPKQQREAILLELYTEACRVFDLVPAFNRDKRTARQLKAFNTRSPARLGMQILLAIIPVKALRRRMMWWDTAVNLNPVPEEMKEISCES
jgi:hypothetical protein